MVSQKLRAPAQHSWTENHSYRAVMFIKTRVIIRLESSIQWMRRRSMALARQGEKHNESFLRGSINSYGESQDLQDLLAPTRLRSPNWKVSGHLDWRFFISGLCCPGPQHDKICYLSEPSLHTPIKIDSFCYTAIFCLINIYHHKFRAILLVEGVASPLKSVFELLSLHCLIKVIMFFVWELRLP